jgi:hypothetical protein
MFAVLAAAVCAIVVANLADFTASVKAKTERRALLAEFDVHSRHLQTRCSKDLMWAGAKWSSGLTAEERTALTELGWKEAVWDSAWSTMAPGITTTTTTTTQTTLFGLPTTTPAPVYNLPMSEYKCWHHLSAIEQDAAKALTYSIQDWIDCKALGCAWPPGVPKATASCLDKMKYQESVFNVSRPWTNFTKRKRDYMVQLGWDPDGVQWKDGRWPNTYGKPWSELTPNEIGAAIFLGYTADIWNGCEKVIDSPCLDRLTHLETKLRSWIWEDIKPGYRERLKDLGWGPKSWFDGERPAVMQSSWIGTGAITSVQRTSARIIGYTLDTWTSGTQCPSAGCIERYAYFQKKWAGRPWMSLKLSERRAWMLLDHSKAKWNAIPRSLPSAMQKKWVEITPEQRAAAMELGSSEGVWQGCNSEWGMTNATQNVTQEEDANTYVRARMTIDRPFSEVSGNVQGNAVASMPVSFIRVFENAVARALFCGNPPLSLDPASYIGTDGGPLCIQGTNFEMQRKRVKVLSVVEGSIVVNFYLVANATPSQPTSRELFDLFQRQLNQKSTSPICHDLHFGRYAKVATMEEIKIKLYPDEVQGPIEFEKKRNMYNAGNMCLLHQDAVDGVTTCASLALGLPRSIFSQGFAGLLVGVIALLCML